MMRFFKNLLMILITFEAFSKEFSYLGRSPKGLLMGDAFTAIADDEFSLFYNPASLGRHSGVSLNPLNVVIGGTNALDELDRFENFPSKDEAAIADRILGLPIHLRAGTYPGLKMAHFGLSLFADSKTNMVLRNAIHPQLDIDYKYDRGFATGAAFNLGSGALFAKGKKNDKGAIKSGERVSVGFGIKHVRREGLSGTYSLMGTKLLSKIASGVSDVQDLKEAFGYSEGKGWGLDLGVEYSKASAFSLFTAGAAVTDIGDIHFRKLEGTEKIPKQYMNFTTGVAFKQDFKIIDYTLSMDLHPLNTERDLMQRLHLGAELGIPFITLYSGLNAGYLSYGATFKFWPIKLTAGFYGIELADEYKFEEAKRFVLYLSLFDFSIDL